MTAPFIVAIVGAESTGKTTLAHALAAALARPGRSVALVEEHLREFCNHHSRTPRRDEQAAIAAEQTRRIASAAAEHALVIADTTALMTAVYSRFVFGDDGLMASALAAHAQCDLSLVTALDLPWEPDGLQRDGAQVREPVDTLLRGALAAGGIGYAVVGGTGPARLAAAVAAVQRALAPAATGAARWVWHCERCGDGSCERHARPG